MESLQLVKIKKPIVVNDSERRKKTRIVDSKNTVVTLYPNQLKPIVINVVQEKQKQPKVKIEKAEKSKSKLHVDNVAGNGSDADENFVLVYRNKIKGYPRTKYVRVNEIEKVKILKIIQDNFDNLYGKDRQLKFQGRHSGEYAAIWNKVWESCKRVRPDIVSSQHLRSLIKNWVKEWPIKSNRYYETLESDDLLDEMFGVKEKNIPEKYPQQQILQDDPLSFPESDSHNIMNNLNVPSELEFIDVIEENKPNVVSTILENDKKLPKSKWHLDLICDLVLKHKIFKDKNKSWIRLRWQDAQKEYVKRTNDEKTWDQLSKKWQNMIQFVKIKSKQSKNKAQDVSGVTGDGKKPINFTFLEQKILSIVQHFEETKSITLKVMENMKMIQDSVIRNIEFEEDIQYKNESNLEENENVSHDEEQDTFEFENSKIDNELLSNDQECKQTADSSKNQQQKLKIIPIFLNPNLQVHVIFYNDEKYLTSADISAMIPRFKGRDILNRMLSLEKEVNNIRPLMVYKDLNKSLFEECIIENVKGIENQEGKGIVEELSLYSFQNIPKIFDIFIPDADPGLIKDYLKLRYVNYESN